MEKINLKEMVSGSKALGLLLLTNIEEKQTKTGAAYCKFTLSDGESIIEANTWNVGKDNCGVEEKTVIAIELSAKMYQDSLSYETIRYSIAPDDCTLTPQDFIIKAPYRPEDMYNDILKICNGIVEGKTNSVVNIVNVLYEANKEQLLYWSAAKMVHHNIYSGLLYHTFNMLRIATVLCKVYPNVNKQVLYSAVALHDVGKLRELETDTLGAADYTIAGTLLSHSLIGIEMVNEATLGMDIDAEQLQCLKHCIASHHGKLEYGAITVPMTTEAYLLHEIDMIDSRMYQYNEVAKTTEVGTLSDKIFGLGSKVYVPNY